MTQYEKIKLMSFEEMRDFLFEIISKSGYCCESCPADTLCNEISDREIWSCKGNFTQWLESEVKE